MLCIIYVFHRSQLFMKSEGRIGIVLALGQGVAVVAHSLPGAGSATGGSVGPLLAPGLVVQVADSLHVAAPVDERLFGRRTGRRRLLGRVAVFIRGGHCGHLLSV